MLRGGLASESLLQQVQPRAHRSFGTLIALPFIFDLEAGPLIGIECFQFRPPELAIGRGLRREQGRIRPANRAFQHFRAHRHHGRLRRLRRGSARASRERDGDGKRGRKAERAPRSLYWIIRHRLVGPNLPAHIGAWAADQAGRS